MKLLIADDHALFREGMRHLLAQLDDAVEVIEAGSCADLLAAVEAQPDIELVLLDLTMPGRDGFVALELLAREHSRLPVVVLSASEDRAAMQRALDGGAVGYIPKTSSAAVMLHALRLVLAGGIYVPPALVHPAPLACGGAAPKAADGSALTPRQLEVLACVIEGKSNRAIAAQLGLSRATVKAHITAAFKALRVSNRAQAAAVAKRLDLRRRAS
ncbi:MAG TPA: response regulator transcription factor [Burkholderiales bacterium]